MIARTTDRSKPVAGTRVSCLGTYSISWCVCVCVCDMRKYVPSMISRKHVAQAGSADPKNRLITGGKQWHLVASVVLTVS